MERQGIIQKLEEAGLAMQAQEIAPAAGQECLDRTSALCSQYERFLLSLRDEEEQGSPRLIVLEKDVTVDGLGRGDVVLRVGSCGYGNGDQPSGFRVLSLLIEEDDAGVLAHGEEEEVSKASLYRAIGLPYYPSADPSEIAWMPEMVEKARTYIDGRELAMQKTLDWMSEAACNSVLNPKIAERAQAYKEELLATA